MDLVTYRPLFWLLLLAPIIAAFCLSLVDRRPLLKLASLVLRCLAVVLIVLALCSPFLMRKVRDAHVIFMVDTSESVDRQQCKAAVERIRELTATLGSADSWSVMEFASEAREIELDALAEKLAEPSPESIGHPFYGETRIANSLLQARMTFPAGKAKRIVMFTDGRETTGLIAEALGVLRDEGVDLQIDYLQSVTHPEVSILSLIPNTPSAYFGEKVRLKAKLSSNRDTIVRLRVYCRGVLEQEAPLQLKADQDNEATIDVVMTTPGATIWTAEIVADDDHFPLNNQASTTIDVKGKAKILVLHQDQRLMRPLARALNKQGMEISVRGVRGLPETLEGILQFDAIVLADVPATELTTRQMLDLKSFVSDFGGGLVMLGSENSFGLGGYYRTPVEEVLPIVSRYEKEKERPSLAMVLVIDKSGSMSGLPIALARQAAKASAELLSPQDRIAIVAFDGQPYLVCEMRSAAEIALISDAIDRISAGGGTNMYPAMEQGMEILAGTQSRIKHMIVLGDGQSTPGAFLELAGEMAESNMTVSAVALGDGADRYLMSEIARIGRGRYYQTMDPANVPRIFSKETVEASRSAIREEPFLPVRIGDDDMISGIDFESIPMLLGYVMTRAKPTARMQLLSESGDPLLATGRYGLGKAVAFTSDATDRWASQWIQWKGFGRFWAQVLRSCLRKDDYHGLDIKREVIGDRIRFTLTSRDDAGAPEMAENWQALIIDESGQRTTRQLETIGIAAHRIDIKRPQAGRFTLRLRETDSGKLKVLHHHEDYPREYRLAGEPDIALAELPRLGDRDAGANLQPITAFEPLRNYLLLAAVACMIAGILTRRI